MKYPIFQKIFAFVFFNGKVKEGHNLGCKWERSGCKQGRLVVNRGLGCKQGTCLQMGTPGCNIGYQIVNGGCLVVNKGTWL